MAASGVETTKAFLPSVHSEDPPDAPPEGRQGLLESLGGSEAHNHVRA